jgi:hypothetical protein
MVGLTVVNPALDRQGSSEGTASRREHSDSGNGRKSHAGGSSSELSRWGELECQECTKTQKLLLNPLLVHQVQEPKKSWPS